MFRTYLTRSLLVPLAGVLAARRTVMHHRGRTGRKERTTALKTRQIVLMVSAVLALTVGDVQWHTVLPRLNPVGGLADQTTVSR
jgi:hypothetical protein